MQHWSSPYTETRVNFVCVYAGMYVYDPLAVFVTSTMLEARDDRSTRAATVAEREMRWGMRLLLGTRTKKAVDEAARAKRKIEIKRNNTI